MSLKISQNLKKMLRKSPASSVWSAIFKDAVFFPELFNNYKIEFNSLAFLSSLLKVHKCRFENLLTCSNSYKNNILKVFRS